jgi:iron complex outermembrane recepter protein
MSPNHPRLPLPAPARRRLLAAVLGVRLSCCTVALLAVFQLEISAQPASSGSVQGRVQSATTGNYLNNARVRVAGTNRETFTSPFGEYRIADLPAGPVTLEVFYTGMSPQTVTVAVPASGSVQKDVVLAPPDGVVGTNADGTVQLASFVVQSQRETDAAAIALNEQRFAANRKDVVSTDAFGEINQGNIGEFVKFLPGISLDVKDGNTPSGIMIRGFDPNYTNVTMDGGQLASTIIANTQTSSRQFVLDGANINNIARIEVAKLPTPDMSANLLGGAVNFVSRTAFERPRREIRLSAYLSANAKAVELDKTPGPLDEDTYKVLPSFDFQYADPVSKRFGYVLTAQHSSQYYLQNRSVFGHRFTGAGATVANPYTTNVQTNFAQNRSDRTSGALTLDYKPWDRHVLSLKLNASASKQQSASRAINYNVGGTQPVRWDERNTFGAATGGSVGISTSFQERHSLNRTAAGSWTFTGEDWTVEAAGTFSHSNNRTRDNPKGFFRSVSVNLPNVGRVNLEDIDHDRPGFGVATVFNTAGQRIDELNLANWNLTQAGSEALNAQDTLKEARLNVTRNLSLFGKTVAFKFGGSVNDLVRDLHYVPVNWTYVGPDRIANNADNTAAGFISAADLGVSPPRPRMAGRIQDQSEFRAEPGPLDSDRWPSGRCPAECGDPFAVAA